MRLLHSITALLLLTLVVAGTGVRTFVTVNFYLHQEEIAAEKCENKAKPELQCNGKCYLAKQLKAADSEKESPSTPVQPDRFSFPDLSFLLSRNLNFLPEGLSAEKGNSPYFLCKISAPYSAVPQAPPEC